MKTRRVAVVGSVHLASARLSAAGLEPVLISGVENIRPQAVAGLGGVLLAPQPPEQIPAQVQAVRAVTDGLPVIQLLTVPDFESIRLAQVAGADYTLLWPHEASQLPALLAAHHQARTQYGYGGGSGRCIALYNPRGGAGLNTLATLLSVALQRRTGSTLLVDMDTRWGGLEALLQVQPAQNLLALRALVQARELTGGALPSVVTPHASGLHLLASPATGTDEAPWPADDWLLLLAAARESYRLSVWVVAPELTPLSAARLWAAFDEVLLVATPAFASLALARRVTQQLPGKTTFPLGLVVNRDGLDPSCTASEVSRLLGIPLRGAIREDRDLLRLGVAPGGPWSRRRPSGALRDVERLAAVLSGGVVTSAPAQRLALPLSGRTT